MVEYKAPFLDSVGYHGLQPWNKDQPLALWKYPVPVDPAQGEPIFFPFAAWKVSMSSVGVLRVGDGCVSIC